MRKAPTMAARPSEAHRQTTSRIGASAGGHAGEAAGEVGEAGHQRKFSKLVLNVWDHSIYEIQDIEDLKGSITQQLKMLLHDLEPKRAVEVVAACRSIAKVIDCRRFVDSATSRRMRSVPLQ